MKKSSRTALGGIIAALSLALMFVVSVVPFMTYALPAVAGAILMLISIEINRKWAFAVFLVVSILSIITVPNKEVAVLYAAFFGYYPILKSVFESKIHFKFLEYLLKFVVFNFSIILSYFLMIRFMGIYLDEGGVFGRFVIPGFIALANIVFFFYDIALTRVISTYLYKWRKQFKRIFK